MQRISALLAVVLASALLVAGCGDDTKVVTDQDSSGADVVRTVPDVKFAKTKFVLHAGLGAGAVKRYIVDPYQEGSFAAGQDGRVAAFAKAALAGAFAVREFKLARNAALSSDVLRTKVADPLGDLIDRIQGATSVFKGGKFDAGDIAAIATGLGSVSSLSDAAGFAFKEKVVPLPGS